MGCKQCAELGHDGCYEAGYEEGRRESWEKTYLVIAELCERRKMPHRFSDGFGSDKKYYCQKLQGEECTKEKCPHRPAIKEA